jgi:hypothetical protein
MLDDANPPQVDIYYEIHTETSIKSKRLNYERIKELYMEAQAIRSELNTSQSKEVLDRLYEFIDELRELDKSTSKYLDSAEVMSDIEWIVEYIQKEEWLNVMRWLSNVDSSIREMWSHYIEQIIKHKKSNEAQNNLKNNV